jgi:hypothetical protein
MAANGLPFAILHSARIPSASIVLPLHDKSAVNSFSKPVRPKAMPLSPSPAE